MDDKPLVSIVINNFNYGRFLRNAIESALNQTYQRTEVVVVDDGSTDNSREIIQEYEGRIIPVLKENGGQASAFNAGFENCKGEIICLLDADDLFMPNKVEVVVREMNKAPGYGWMIHRMNHIDEHGKEIQIAEREEQNFLLRESGDYREVSRFKKINFILPATSALAFRRSLIERISPVPVELRITADNYLKFAALMVSPILVCDELLSSQLIHGNNLYTNMKRESKAFREKSRQINYHIAKGLWQLDKKQTLTFRFLFRVMKSAVRDVDLSMFYRSAWALMRSVLGYSF